MKLIPNWRKAWRMLSMQAMAAAAILQTAWETNPDAIRAVLPSAWVPWVTVALLLFGMAGRVVQQRKVTGSEP
jgi:hypothetical protein